MRPEPKQKTKNKKQRIVERHLRYLKFIPAKAQKAGKSTAKANAINFLYRQNMANYLKQYFSAAQTRKIDRNSTNWFKCRKKTSKADRQQPLRRKRND